MNVLIADDCAGIRRILAQILRRTRFVDDLYDNLYEVANQSEVLTTLARADCIKLIFADINPPVGGLDLVSLLRAHPRWKNIPVIIVYCDGTQIEADRAIHLGAAAKIFKPFTDERVREAVTEAITNK